MINDRVYRRIAGADSGRSPDFLFRVVGMHLLRYGPAFTHRQCRINSNGSRG